MTIGFGSVTQAVIRVANADGIVAVGGAVWIKTDDGRAVRIDPATNKITAQVALDKVSDPSNYCQGIGTDGQSVWACAARDDGTGLAQIRARDAQVLRRIQIHKVFDQLSLPHTPGGVWALTGNGSTVEVINPATGKPRRYSLGVACQQLAAEGDRLVATGSVANLVVVMNTTTGAVIGRVRLRTPGIAAVFGRDYWVDTADGLTRIGPDLAPRSIYPDLVAGYDGDVVAAAGSVWIRAGDGTISRIDPETGQVVERMTPDHPLTAGSLYLAYDSIWTTSSDDGTVVRLRLHS